MPVLEAVNTTTYRIRIGRDNIELGDLLSDQCLGHLKYAAGTHLVYVGVSLKWQ